MQFRQQYLKIIFTWLTLFYVQPNNMYAIILELKIPRDKFKYSKILILNIL